MTVYLSHATSFCGGVWRPVIDDLGEIETFSWDHPGHGTGPPLEMPVDWRRFGEGVLDVTQPGGIGVGHSMGAAALVMAQIADPGRFRALILIEPIVFPGPYERNDGLMAQIALKRRRVFESRDEAIAGFTGREPFDRWHPDALNGYLECGLVGEGPVTLACDPEVEADIYRASSAHDTWERASTVDVPVLVMAGAESDTISAELARRQAGLFGRGGLEIVADSGHFLPMEKPHLVADRVRRLYEVALPDLI
jgi:pimeloyl-ACP methyl ester carboxylesterase